MSQTEEPTAYKMGDFEKIGVKCVEILTDPPVLS